MQPDTVVAAAGTCFAISDRAGDMDSHAAHGFYAFDTRLLSLYRVRVQSRGLVSVGSSTFRCLLLHGQHRTARSGGEHNQHCPRPLRRGRHALPDRFVTTPGHREETCPKHLAKPTTAQKMVGLADSLPQPTVRSAFQAGCREFESRPLLETHPLTLPRHSN